MIKKHKWTIAYRQNTERCQNKFSKSLTAIKKVGLSWWMINSSTWMVSQSFDCPHNGSQCSVSCHAVPLSCHMDGWGREQQQRPWPALLCITFCWCTHSVSVSPRNTQPLCYPRPTNRQTEMLIVPLGSPLILPITLFTASSMPTPTSFPVGPDPRSIRTLLSASLWTQENTHR